VKIVIDNLHIACQINIEFYTIINKGNRYKPMLHPIFRTFLTLFSFISLSTFSYAQEKIQEPEVSASDAVYMGKSGSNSIVPLPGYEAADKHALNLDKKYKKIPELAEDLAAPFFSDEEKVRSIFIWITDNIAYNCPEFHSDKAQRVSFSYRTPGELAEKRKKFYYEYATKVLKNRKGICEGYSVLFQELCLANGIPCEIVIGVASDNVNKIGRLKGKKNFSTNHAWVKVKIGNDWFYADPTWASGYCDRAVKKFFKSYNPEYYLTPVDKLYPTHAVNEKQTGQRNSLLVKK
jgi:transglutaminase/protease-like cytokinesis protein 3